MALYQLSQYKLDGHQFTLDLAGAQFSQFTNQTYTLTHNIVRLNALFDKLSLNLVEYKTEIDENIAKNNTQIIIVSLLMIMFGFFIIIPPLRTY